METAAPPCKDMGAFSLLGYIQFHIYIGIKGQTMLPGGLLAAMSLSLYRFSLEKQQGILGKNPFGTTKHDSGVRALSGTPHILTPVGRIIGGFLSVTPSLLPV